MTESNRPPSAGELEDMVFPPETPVSPDELAHTLQRKLKMAADRRDTDNEDAIKTQLDELYTIHPELRDNN